MDIAPTGGSPAVPAEESTPTVPEGTVPAPLPPAPAPADKGLPPLLNVTMNAVELAGIANIIAKGVIEHESGELDPFAPEIPIFPTPAFGILQEEMNNRQDATLTGLRLFKYSLYNGLTLWNLKNPPQIRTDGETGFMVQAADEIFGNSVMASLPYGLIVTQQDGWFARSAIFFNAAFGLMTTGREIQQRSAVLDDDGCMPWKASTFDGGAEACEEHMENTANGTDSVMQGYFGTDGSAASTGSGKQDALPSAYEAAQTVGRSQLDRAYAMNNYLIFQQLEAAERPTWWSIFGLAPFILDLNVNREVPESDGSGTVKMTGGQIAGRALMASSAFALTAVTDDPLADLGAANTLSFAVVSPYYPAILSGTMTNFDPLAGKGTNTYDNDDSLFRLTPKIAIGGYAADVAWSGFMSGYVFARTDGLQRWMPMALTATGFGLQVYANATEGNPQMWKYVAGGAGLAAAGTAGGIVIGNWLDKRAEAKKAKQVAWRPNVTPTAGGLQLGVSGTF